MKQFIFRRSPPRHRDPDRGLMADFCHHVDDSRGRGRLDLG